MKWSKRLLPAFLLAALLPVAASAAPPSAKLAGFSAFAKVNTAGPADGVGVSGDGRTLTLTAGKPDMAASIFFAEPQECAAFTATFTYQAGNLGTGADGAGDGIALVLQADPRGVKALGDPGGGLGYGASNGPAAVIRPSVALQLNLYQPTGANAGGAAGINLATNGLVGSYHPTGAVDLRSGHPIHFILGYSGGKFTAILIDQTTGALYTTTRDLDLPWSVGTDKLRVGFTGSSGGATATQTVTDFTFTPEPPPKPATQPAPKAPAFRHGPLTENVDPFIGTDGGGNCYPGAVAPFGMVQLSPETSSGSIGYLYHQPNIIGFALTHMSGVGCPDYGNGFFTATTGPVVTKLEDYRSPYKHSDEKASPGYYQVRLDKWNVNAELTAAERAGVARFTFPAGVAANVLIPVSHTQTDTYAADVTIVGDREVQGSVTSRSFCGGQGRYTVYFVMRFDKPFQSFGTFTGDAKSDGGRGAAQKAEGDPAVGAYVTWPGDAAAVTTVTASTGISFVDLDGARRNLEQEIGQKSFDDVRKATAAAWEKSLGKIEIEGGRPAARKIFYTALYHALLMPNLFSDIDGRYAGFDDKIHQSPDGRAVYCNFSGWDIYRTQVQLLALIEPKRLEDMCQSVVLMAQQGGWVGRWPQAQRYTNVMLGSPLTTMLATAWNYGLHDFDMKAAYPYLLKDATEPAPPGKPYQGQSNVQFMNQVGYIPDDKEGYGSVSQTQEDCISYAALASVASDLGKADDAKMLTKRSLNYRNVFDPQTKYFRPRLLDGSWQTPFAPPTQREGYVEGSAAQYRWLAPHDVVGMIDLFGGDDPFNKELDTFFSQIRRDWGGAYYTPDNETDLQAPFLYNFSGQPWKTQALVRRLVREEYGTGPEGIPGNDDCGTMSAWAIFAMSGLYPTDPARPAFELCSPVFTKITYHLAEPYKAKALVIEAPAASIQNGYITAVKLGGEDHPAPWVALLDLVAGKPLTFTLVAEPDKAWGAAKANRPPSISTASHR